MTTQRFPVRREDGSAEVAAVFHAPLDDVAVALERAVSKWHEILSDVDTSADLTSDPRIVSSSEGFRVVFEIQPGSRLWRDWAVALVSSINEHLDRDSFVGFFDGVAGRMHTASRTDLLDDGEPE